MLRHRFLGLGLATALLAISPLFGATRTQAGGGTGGRTIVFGAPLSLSGSLAQEGRLVLNGYRLWEREVDTHGGLTVGGTRYDVQIKWYDDGSSVSRSAQLAERLVTSDRVNFLLGPYGSAATLAAETVAKRHRVPMVVGTAAATAVYSQGNSYLFGVNSLAPSYGDVMLRAAHSVPNAPRTVAIIYADDPFSREVAADSRAFAPRLGMQVVAYRMYPSGATDLRAVLKSVMHAGPGGAVPDMLLGSGHLVESIAAMRAARALGTNPKLYAFTVGPGTAGFLGALGRDANDVISSVQWTADQGTQGIDVFGTAASYARIYRSVYGSAPPYQAAEASAAGLAYQYAIERAGSIDPARVRSSLATLNVQTFAGPLRFDARGANVYKGMATIQIQNGRAVTVYPQAATGARLVYPTPPFGSR